MRAVQDGMLWLENRQKETNAVPSQQHNQEHSDGEPEAHSVEYKTGQAAVTATLLGCQNGSKTGPCNRVLKTKFPTSVCHSCYFFVNIVLFFFPPLFCYIFVREREFAPNAETV